MANRVSSEILLKVRDKASRALGKVEKNFKGMNRALEKTERRLKTTSQATRKLQMRMEKLGRGARNVGAGITAGITLPATLMGRSALEGFRKVEDGILGVAKTTDLSEAQLQGLQKRFLEIGKTVPIATENMFNFAQIGGQLGLEGTQQLEEFAVEMGKLEAATDLAGEEAAITLAQIGGLLGVFEETGGFTKFGSALVNVGNNVKATEGQITPLLARIAQGTAVFGLSAEQAVGLAGAMADLKINAEAGGTQVGKSFFAIRNAINEGGQALELLSRITGRTGKQLQTEMGEQPFQVFQRMVMGLGELEKQGIDSSKALTMLGLDGVRAQRVFGTLATRFDRVEFSLAKAREGFKDGNAAQREFETRTSGLTGRLALFDNRLLEIQFRVGQKLRPAFEQVLLVIEKIADFLANNPGLTKFLIWTTATLAVLGPVLIILGQLTLILKAMAPLMALIGAKLAGIGFVALGIALAKIVFFGAAVAAIFAGLYTVFTRFGEILDGIVFLWDKFTEKIMNSTFVNKLRGVLNTVKQIGGAIGDTLGIGGVGESRGQIETQPRGSSLETERAASSPRASLSRAEASIRFENLPANASLQTGGIGDGIEFLLGPSNLASRAP